MFFFHVLFRRLYSYIGVSLFRIFTRWCFSTPPSLPSSVQRERSHGGRLPVPQPLPQGQHLQQLPLSKSDSFSGSYSTRRARSTTPFFGGFIKRRAGSTDPSIKRDPFSGSYIKRRTRSTTPAVKLPHLSRKLYITPRIICNSRH